jgi:hypothetical protein
MQRPQNNNDCEVFSFSIPAYDSSFNNVASFKEKGTFSNGGIKWNTSELVNFLASKQSNAILVASCRIKGQNQNQKDQLSQNKQCCNTA